MANAKQLQKSQDEAITGAQLKKLNLEIEALRRSLEAKRSWTERATPILSIITTLLAVSGFLFGIYQSNRQLKEQSQREAEARKSEFKKAFWEKQLQVYLDVSKTAGKLIAAKSLKERRGLYMQLSELINGNLIVVADESVKNAAIAFQDRYMEFTHNPKYA